MKTFRPSITWISMLFGILIALFACSDTEEQNETGEHNTTPFKENLIQDQQSPSPTYEALVAGVGQETADRLVEGIGSEQLDRLSYGVGTTNIVQLVNIITDVDKLITLVGNDYSDPPTGLGALRVISLLTTIDDQMAENRYDGSLPSDQDTITKMGSLINSLSSTELNEKVVGLVDAMSISRSMQSTEDATKVQNLSKLIAHASDLNKVVTVLQTMETAKINTNLSQVLTDSTEVGELVAIIDGTNESSKLVSLIESNEPAKLVEVINNMSGGGGTKLGYVIDSVNDLSIINTLVGQSDRPSRLSELINKVEDGTTWTGQVGDAQTWNGAPSGSDSGMVRLVSLVNDLSAGNNPNKLLKILDNVSDMTKMMRLIQDVQTIDDVTSLLQNLADPTVNDVPILNLSSVLDNIDVAGMPNMVMIVDGQRCCSNTGTQTTYQTNLIELIGTLSIAAGGTSKTASLIAGVTFPDKIVDLVYETTELTKLSTLLNDINQEASTIASLVQIVNDTQDTQKLITLIQTVADIGKVVTILNNMDGNGGSKLGYLIDNVNQVSTLVTLVNDVTDPSKLSHLVNEIEDGTTWDDQVGSAQTWNSAPSGSDSGMIRLVQLVNDLSAGANPDKLLAILDGVTDMTKMMRLIQDLTTIADVITLIGNLPDPASNAVPSQNLANILENIRLLYIPRMTQLVDGQRCCSNTGTQSDYLEKLLNLITLLESASSGPEKVVELVEGVSEPDKIIDLVNDVSSISNLAIILNGINQSTEAFPNNTAITTLVYMVENIAESSKLVTLINDVTATNIRDLVNLVAAGSQWSDSQPDHTQVNVDDLQAAGKKLAGIIDNVSEVTNLVTVLNGVSDFNKMSDLVNSLLISGSATLAGIVNDVTDMNKLIDLIDNTSDLTEVADLISGVSNSSKLSGLINDTTNSAHVVSLLNAVLSESTSTTSDLVGMLNTLAVDDIGKVAQLVNDLAGTEDQLIAQLVAPYLADSSQGVGYATLASLLASLSSTSSASKLATLISSLNTNLSYLGGNISTREGLVRLLTSGVTYLSVEFPGIGPVHVATLMDNANSAENLATLLNGLGMENLAPLIGCVDRVGDPEGDGLEPFDPDFHTPCGLIGMGW